MMLKEFVEKKHYKFADSAADWKEAIRMSCEPLEFDGTVEDNYKEDIIKCVEKYGPYIVIAPNIAMPHSQEGAEGVNKTAVSFMNLEIRNWMHSYSLHWHPVIQNNIWIICQDCLKC